MLIRRPDLQDLFTQSWNVAVAKNGPVSRIASAVDFLDAEWTESFVIKTSAGVELNLLSTDKGEFQHNLREAIRQMIIHKDAPIHTRKDLVGGPLFLYESNTKLLRASEKVSVSDPSFKLNLFERATLRNIMTGTTRTAVRLHAANQLDSTTCLWCQLNHEEDHDHFFWTCPAWENKRLAFFSKWGNKVFSLPPCTRHCGLLPANVLDSHFSGSAKEATLFTVDMQRTMIAVTHARDHANKENATQMPEAYQEDNCTDDNQSDKCSTGAVSEVQTADPKNMFPTYPWSYDIDFEGQTFFHGEIPEQWRRYSKGSEWLFGLTIFESLHWFWTTLQWSNELHNAATITWFELALDFHACTHCPLHLPDQTSDQLTIYSIASFFMRASKRMAAICKNKILWLILDRRRLFSCESFSVRNYNFFWGEHAVIL